MKTPEVRHLVKIAEEISEKVISDYHSWFMSELRDSGSSGGLRFAMDQLDLENQNIRSVRIPWYVSTPKLLEDNLCIQPGEEGLTVVFRPWYESLVEIEKDQNYLRSILKFFPDLIDDGAYAVQRATFEYGNSSVGYGVAFDQTSFYWNVHLLVLGYHYYSGKKIILIKEVIQRLRKAGNGLNCALSREDKIRMHSKMKGVFICDQTPREDFVAAITPEPLPYGFNEIKWVLTGKENKPHKTALREFLTLYCLTPSGNRGRVPKQEDINRVFRDSAGRKIILAKPTVQKPSNYYRDLETLLS